jgi:hypothetical protein
MEALDKRIAAQAGPGQKCKSLSKEKTLKSKNPTKVKGLDRWLKWQSACLANTGLEFKSNNSKIMF